MRGFLASLIPYPRYIEPSGRRIERPRGLRLVLTGLDPASAASLAKLAGIVLKNWLRPSGGSTPVLLALRPKAAFPRLRAVPEELARQAYELAVGRQISLAAPDVAGLRLGLQTLRQMLEEAEPGATLHGCRILDWPRIANRGVHYDLAREMEYRPAHLRSVVERLAYFKLNQLHLYLENKFLFPSCPRTAPPRVLTPQQAKELCAYAELFGITVIPQISTLGHVEHFLHGELAKFREDPLNSFNLCPTHPEVRPWLAGMIADVAAAFPSPYIHVGYDESHSGWCTRCRRHGTPQQILADHLNWLNAEVKRHGRRTMIYGDKFLSREEFPMQDAANGGTKGEARAALARVDRDVLMTNWHYTSPFSGTTRALRRAGFEVWGVCDTAAYWHDSIPVHRAAHWIAETMERDIAEGATGTCNCTWELYRGQFFDNFWFHHALAAERAWTDRPHDYVSWGERFCSRFWGVDGDPYTELAGLAEVTPVARRVAFVDNHILDVGVGAALTPLWPSWQQAVFDFPETGEQILRGVKALARQAIRNADALRFLDLPGEIIRYVGVRARQRLLLERALAAADRAGAIKAVSAMLVAAKHVAARLDEGYRLCGNGVVDRVRIRRHVASAERCLKLLRASRPAAIRELSAADIIFLEREQCGDPTKALAFRGSALVPKRGAIRAARRPARGTAFAPVGIYGPEQLSDVRPIHGGRDGVVFLRATPTLSRAAKGRLLYGADGPVKVWVNGQLAGCEPAASNPLLRDQYSAPAAWRKGKNEVLLAIDTNHGKAWGVVARVKLDRGA